MECLSIDTIILISTSSPSTTMSGYRPSHVNSGRSLFTLNRITTTGEFICYCAHYTTLSSSAWASMTLVLPLWGGWRSMFKLLVTRRVMVYHDYICSSSWLHSVHTITASARRLREQWGFWVVVSWSSLQIRRYLPVAAAFDKRRQLLNVLRRDQIVWLYVQEHIL